MHAKASLVVAVLLGIAVHPVLGKPIKREDIPPSSKSGGKERVENQTEDIPPSLKSEGKERVENKPVAIESTKNKTEEISTPAASDQQPQDRATQLFDKVSDRLIEKFLPASKPEGEQSGLAGFVDKHPVLSGLGVLTFAAAAAGFGYTMGKSKDSSPITPAVIPVVNSAEIQVEPATPVAAGKRSLLELD